eukprot:TRINITY_DN105258_c1_g1_i1.p1 TRINITY_DN105258_c1_g1~~TRINITY_DN105258_c1_g1_i1.p1  ORF type:complete len:1270 (+),score=160.59 TRINITY_DN105258_c1_g1_i1:129-3812(+)
MNSIEAMYSEIAKGDNCMRSYRYPEAIYYYERAVEIHRSWQSYSALGRALFIKGEYKKAEDSLKKALNHSPSYKEDQESLALTLDLAKCENALKNNADAIAYCKKGIGIAKGLLMAPNKNTEVKKMLEELQKLMDKIAPNLQKEGAEQLFKNAKDLKDRGQFLNAAAVFSKSIQENPKSEAFLQRGLCYMQLGKFEEALRDFETGVKMRMEAKSKADKFVVQGLLYKGVCLAKLEHKEKSQEVLNEALNNAEFIGDSGLISQIKDYLSRNSTTIPVEPPTKTLVHHKDPSLSKETESERMKAIKLLSTIGTYKTNYSCNKWHIVPIKWFNKWKTYVKLPEAQSSSSLYYATGKGNYIPEHPGPITNEELLVREKILKDPVKEHHNRPIRPELKENVDFIIVPEELWNIWEKAYGGYDIQRFSYMEDRKLDLDIYLQRISLVFLPLISSWVPQEMQVVYAPKNETVKGLNEKFSRIIKELMKPGRTEVIDIRLWRTQESFDDIRRAFENMAPRQKRLKIEGRLLGKNEKVEDIKSDNGANVLILVELSLADQDFIVAAKSHIHSHKYDIQDTPMTDVQVQNVTTSGDFSYANEPLDRILSVTANMGLTGIENITNSCYMNAGLQCLSSCMELTKYFLLGLYKRDLNRSNPLGRNGELAIAYAKLIEALWKGPQRNITTYDLKAQLSRKAEQFKGYSQQDSEEFVAFLLDGLHEDLNRAKPISLPPAKEDDEEEQWRQYQQKNSSIITDLFSGQMRTKITCPSCNNSVNKFETFLAISVPIPLINHLTVVCAPKEITTPAVKKTLTVQDGMSMSDLGTKLKENTTSKYMYAFVNSGEITKRIPESVSAVEVANKSHEAYAFEYECEEEEKMIPNIKKAKHYLLEIQVIQVEGYSYVYPRTTSAKRPLVLCVSLEQTLEKFKIDLFQKLAPFFHGLRGKSRREIEKVYKEYFRDIDNKPYYLNIVSGMGICEFCGTWHKGDCELHFKDEHLLTLDKLVAVLKGKRELVLTLVVKGNDKRIDAANLMRQLNTVEVDQSVASNASGLMQGKKSLTIYDCLDAFSKEEQLDQANLWDCAKCKAKVQGVKNVALCKLPPILIIHLKRFKQRTTSFYVTTNKIEEFVDYPIDGLDLGKYAVSPEKEKTRYNLFGVTNHFGGTGGGHYTAVCKNEPKDQWVEFDDTRLYKARKEDIVSKAGYVLYYRRAYTCQQKLYNHQITQFWIIMGITCTHTH